MNHLSKKSNFLDNFFTSIYEFPQYPTLSNSLFNGWNEDNKVHSTVVEVPGFKNSELKMHVEGNSVSISGKIEKAGYAKTVNYVLPLPRHVDLNSLSAKVEDGLLTISVNSTMEAKSKSREIEVK